MLRGECVADVAGLGIDEGAALCIDSDGVGRLYPGEQDGFAWLVRPTQAPGRLERGQPLEVDGVRVTGIGADIRLRLPGLEVQAPAFEKIARRSEEHTSELQSLMRISYAVFCLKKKINKSENTKQQHSNNT